MLVGCGQPPGGPRKTATLGSRAKPPPPPAKDPDVLLGWMCPTAAAGRPGVVPIAHYAGRWSVDPSRSRRLIAGKSARQFSVLGWLGKRSGLFSVAGAATSGGKSLAVGSYAGSPPCHDEQGENISACITATGGCAIAVARLEPSGGLKARPFEEDPDPHDIRARRLCLDAKEVQLDVDGDGRAERFPRSSFFVGSELPSELVATSSAKTSCDVPLAVAQLQPSLYIVGSADFDDDGRSDFLLLHRGKSETVLALYRSTQTPLRLERAFKVRVITP